MADPPDFFGEDVAASYDADSASMFGPEVLGPTVDLLAELAGDGRALELGIGTGRVALPLAARGVPVHGIELSRAMSARLRAKPGGETIEVAIGDFAGTRVDGAFTLAYLVFNTISNLTTQDAQVACFANVSAHLEPGGRFLIEVGIPDLQRLPPGQTVCPFALEDDHLGFDEYDVANQGLVSHHFTLEDGRLGARLDPVPLHVAGRVGPDGAARRDAAARPLERLAARAVHRATAASTSPSGRSCRPSRGLRPRRARSCGRARPPRAAGGRA